LLDRIVFDWRFDGATLVGADKTQLLVFDTTTAKLRTSWQLPGEGWRLLAVRAREGLVVATKNSSAEVRRLADGTLVGALEESAELQAATFGPSGLVALSSGSRIAFWRVPAAKRIGELLVDGKDVAFIASDGKFDTNGAPSLWQSRLRCTVGSVALPFEDCVDSLYTAGAAHETND
jgi:hypothetical protein